MFKSPTQPKLADDNDDYEEFGLLNDLSPSFARLSTQDALPSSSFRPDFSELSTAYNQAATLPPFQSLFPSPSQPQLQIDSSYPLRHQQEGQRTPTPEPNSSSEEEYQPGQKRKLRSSQTKKASKDAQSRDEQEARRKERKRMSNKISAKASRLRRKQLEIQTRENVETLRIELAKATATLRECLAKEEYTFNLLVSLRQRAAAVTAMQAGSALTLETDEVLEPTPSPRFGRR